MNQPTLWNLQIVETTIPVGAGSWFAGREGAEQMPFVFDETYPRRPAPTKTTTPSKFAFKEQKKSAPICVICGSFRGKR